MSVDDITRFQVHDQLVSQQMQELGRTMITLLFRVDSAVRAQVLFLEELQKLSTEQLKTLVTIADNTEGTVIKNHNYLLAGEIDGLPTAGTIMLSSIIPHTEHPST